MFDVEEERRLRIINELLKMDTYVENEVNFLIEAAERLERYIRDGADNNKPGEEKK